jgi:ribosome biogenesis protein UTP30
MSKSKEDEQLIDSKVSSSQTKLAIDALLKHALKHTSEKEQTELLPGKDQFVWLVLTTKKVHAEKKLKPFKL